jgi:hypothetical protein
MNVKAVHGRPFGFVWRWPVDAADGEDSVRAHPNETRRDRRLATTTIAAARRRALKGGNMRYPRLLVVALAATLFAAVGAASPALAAPAQTADLSVCSTQFGSDCQTLSVQALGGDVRIVLYAPTVGLCYYNVRDTNNWQVVRSGAFWQGLTTTIGGLYSRYRAELYSCPAFSEAHISG